MAELLRLPARTKEWEIKVEYWQWFIAPDRSGDSVHFSGEDP
jgi:hypothetical protein